MKIVQDLNWSRPRSPKQFPGGGTVYRNGKATNLAATRIFTVFGFGFCLYDQMDFNGRFIVLPNGRKMRRGISLGFFQFRKDDQGWVQVEVERKFVHRRVEWTHRGQRIVRQNV